MENRSDSSANKTVSRRAFIQGTTLVMLTGSADIHAASKSDDTLQIGLITDIHYADKNTAGSRHYRDSKDKMTKAVEYFNKTKPAFVIELGDLIDRAVDVETELRYLKTIEAEYSKLKCSRYYVYGNHCLDTLTKDEFIANSGMKAPYYSFDKGHYHFVVLDACFNSKGEPYGRRNFKWNDANVSEAELKWLKKDLAKNKKPTIVFTHQRLDPVKNYMIKNADKVREILVASGNVKAVLQGHSHKNEHKFIDGIHYCVVRAMVEGAGQTNNSYGLLRIEGQDKLMLKGFYKQDDYSIEGKKVEHIKKEKPKPAKPKTDNKKSTPKKDKPQPKP